MMATISKGRIDVVKLYYMMEPVQMDTSRSAQSWAPESFVIGDGLTMSSSLSLHHCPRRSPRGPYLVVSYYTPPPARGLAPEALEDRSGP